MQVKYRLIDNGKVVGEQVVSDINETRITSDVFDGMDPLQLAKDGKRVTWVEWAEVIA